MESIDSLIEKHAELRRLAGELERTIGKQRGVGWDDRGSCGPEALRAAQRRLQDELKDHETREERVIDAILRESKNERAELEPEIQRAHGTLNGLTTLLSSLTGICDGTHIYAVRSVAERLHDELDAHLAYEEKVLFPLLRRLQTKV